MMVFRQPVADIFKTRSHHIVDGFVIRIRQGLGEDSNLDARPHPAFAAITLDVAGNQFHQSRLAGPVASQQANAIAFAEGEVDAVKQAVCPKIQGNIGKG